MLKLASQSVRQRLSWLPSLVVFGFLLFAIVLADTRSAMAVPPPSLRMRAIPAFARKYGMPCSACHEAWHGIPYLRANAGMARIRSDGGGTAIAERVSARTMAKSRNPKTTKDGSQESLCLTDCDASLSIPPPRRHNSNIS